MCEIPSGLSAIGGLHHPGALPGLVALLKPDVHRVDSGVQLEPADTNRGTRVVHYRLIVGRFSWLASKTLDGQASC